ncbi:MAG: protein kinase, partial [Victivallales bacterium]
MIKLVCRGCGSIIDAVGIEPFTLCSCSGCGTELTIPFEMGHLTLEKPLYEKSLFAAYEGFDRALNTSSTIFVLHKDNPEFSKFHKIVKDEAAALTMLKHPNICPVLNYGEIDGNFFVTEPKMDGYGLSEYSPETQGLLDVEKVIDVLLAAALGLAVAHHKEFVHHDLCPENIHVDARGNVRTKNFFISRFTYQYLQDTDVIASSVSPYFISPEKVESHVEDKRGDVFSFGVIFYYMLTGKYPFSGKNEVETLYSRVKKRKPLQPQMFTAEKPLVLAPETVDYQPPSPPSYFRSDIPVE